jgi:hypothetical protein
VWLNSITTWNFQDSFGQDENKSNVFVASHAYLLKLCNGAFLSTEFEADNVKFVRILGEFCKMCAVAL